VVLPALADRPMIGEDFIQSQKEDRMALFIVTINWTEQGIRNVKDAPKRRNAARDLAKKCGVDIKQLYLTSGDSDLLAIVDTPSGDNVAKFAMAIGSQGNIRTRTVRAWTEAEFDKLVSELPSRPALPLSAGCFPTRPAQTFAPAAQLRYGPALEPPL
jgi:uncharacterized protein with GYD domain